MNSIELFAGAGGMSLGLEKAGWRSKLLIERDSHACNTLRLNRENEFHLSRSWNVLEGDVRDVDYGSIEEKIDLIAGGPPCQPFSLGGKHNAHLDERDMFPEAIRAIRELRPKYFLFENVKGLLRKSFAEYFGYILIRLRNPFETNNRGESWQKHLARLTSLENTRGAQGSSSAYEVSFQLVDAANHGVPQHRHRIVIVGVRKDLGFTFKFPRASHSAESLLIDKYVSGKYWDKVGLAAEEDHFSYKALEKRIARLRDRPEFSFCRLKPHVTVQEAIGDLPFPLAEGSDQIDNHQLRLGAKPYPGHTGSLLHFPSKAIKAGVHGVPGGENMIAYADGSYRYYTTREAARVQTFPDGYIFTGSWTESMRQIGNAVPVSLAAKIGSALRSQAAENEEKARRKVGALQSA